MARGIFAGVVVALLLGTGISAKAAETGSAREATHETTTGPVLRSASALVLDANNSEVIYERDAGLVTPIASVTKLMTALVVLEGQQPLDEVIQITTEDRWTGKGAFSRLPIGSKITRADLLRLALMASENRASRTLARNYPGGIPAFVRTMNLKAKALGMARTHFDYACGLSSQNVSNARDLARLINAASREPLIREYSTLPSYEVRLGRNSVLEFHNTNLLVGKPDWTIEIQKTGFTNDAGECLVMQTLIDERPVVMVLLNSFGKLTRTADARRIRKWMESQSSPSLASTGAGK